MCLLRRRASVLKLALGACAYLQLGHWYLENFQLGVITPRKYFVGARLVVHHNSNFVRAGAAVVTVRSQCVPFSVRVHKRFPKNISATPYGGCLYYFCC